MAIEQRTGTNGATATLEPEASSITQLKHPSPGVIEDQQQLNGAHKLLEERLQRALSIEDIQKLESKLGSDTTATSIREELAKSTKDFCSAVQFRDDGFCQDYSNTFTLIATQLDCIPAYITKNTAYAQKLINRIPESTSTLEGYDEFLSRKDLLNVNPAAVTATKTLREYGLAITMKDLRDLLPDEISSRISNLITSLKELSGALTKEGENIPLSPENIRIIEQMDKAIQAEMTNSCLFYAPWPNSP
jgi:hypothetical protein